MKLITFISKRLRTISLAELLIVLVISGLTIAAIRYLFLRESGEWRFVYLQIEPIKNSNDLLDPSTQWAARQIRVGDTYYSANGRLYAETVAVENYDISQTTLSTFATVKLRGLFQPRDKRFVFENRRVSVGETLTLYFSDKQVTGRVLQIGTSIDEITALIGTTDVTLRLKLMDSWLTNAFIKNVPFDVVEASSNNIILHIDSSSVEVPDYTTYSTFAAGDMRSTAVTAENDYRDLILSGTITLSYRFGQWYFAGSQPVKIGSIIQFSTPQLNTVYARIQDITLPPGK